MTFIEYLQVGGGFCFKDVRGVRLPTIGRKILSVWKVAHRPRHKMHDPAHIDPAILAARPKAIAALLRCKLPFLSLQCPHQMVLLLVQLEDFMRTTVTLDDDLLAKAVKLTGGLDRSTVLREGLKALIERESAARLAKLGGTQPHLEPVPRRRAAAAT
jgi:Arc/MetJ family transcription regulator